MVIEISFFSFCASMDEKLEQLSFIVVLKVILRSSILSLLSINKDQLIHQQSVFINFYQFNYTFLLWLCANKRAKKSIKQAIKNHSKPA